MREDQVSKIRNFWLARRLLYQPSMNLRGKASDDARAEGVVTMLAERALVRDRRSAAASKPASRVRKVSPQCALCAASFEPTDRVLWIPGLDLPAHESCLDLELQQVFAEPSRRRANAHPA